MIDAKIEVEINFISFHFILYINMQTKKGDVANWKWKETDRG